MNMFIYLFIEEICSTSTKSTVFLSSWTVTELVFLFVMLLRYLKLNSNVAVSFNLYSAKCVSRSIAEGPSGDRRVSLSEFKKSAQTLGLAFSGMDAEVSLEQA